MQDTSLATWHANFATNTHAVFEMMHYTLPHIDKASRMQGEPGPGATGVLAGLRGSIGHK